MYVKDMVRGSPDGVYDSVPEVHSELSGALSVLFHLAYP